MFNNTSDTENSANNLKNILAHRDRGMLWHPYAPLETKPLYGVLSAQGTQLQLQDEEGFTHTALDAMSSWWCQVHGYSHPALNQALREQIEKFSHVMFGGLTHEPAINLAERLVRLAPGELNHVFLADSGSVSVEVALKLAVQYQRALGRPTKNRFLALEGGYHGDTIGAMSVCDPIGGMHSEFRGFIPEQLFAPRPPSATYDNAQQQWSVNEQAQHNWQKTTEAIIAKEHDSLAAIVVEPIVQGAGGMHFYHPHTLNTLRELADRYELLLIFDEIATGFGRTGKFFATEWSDIVPDVMTVGKALTGGYLTQAAVLVSTNVASTISDSEHRALLHGPTFMGNPLASAASCTSLDLLTGALEGYPLSCWEQSIPRLEQTLNCSLAPARSLTSVRDVRVLGGIGVIELYEDVRIFELTQAALRRGVWVRPFRNLVYTMPPYIATEEEVQHIGRALVESVAEVHGE
ncbi:adenosylmethionine--8-amino-7-oxononanoate transaminase [Rothia sp. P6271]|uniref:adenosylmethionine--8-amino-7-oxononanoate transaminase n=1 Tax=Rothia sp. P6271 TaxID=3402659 RepID=UPI003ACE60D4